MYYLAFNKPTKSEVKYKIIPTNHSERLLLLYKKNGFEETDIDIIIICTLFMERIIFGTIFDTTFLTSWSQYSDEEVNKRERNKKNPQCLRATKGRPIYWNS